MKIKVITVITIIVCSATKAAGQTFTENLNRYVPGQGRVTVVQSKDIDDLVNAKHDEVTVANTPATTPEKSKEAENKLRTNAEKKTSETENTETPVIDNRKKIMVGSRKVTGYRVQAFAGGNKRADRQKAERIGDQIKASFPNEPIYVHFYSPRWICRVGNYRTYQEAHSMLMKIRGLGIQGACVVKGKITVQ